MGHALFCRGFPLFSPCCVPHEKPEPGALMGHGDYFLMVARIPSLPLPATTALFPPELVQVDANCTILPSHSICHPLLSAVRHLPSAVCRLPSAVCHPLSHLALQPALGSIHKQCPRQEVLSLQAVLWVEWSCYRPTTAPTLANITHLWC
ncbi:hypothetical protein M405DRAFT_834005 [Rhizopogon salebrosus TDB-379]|nr:hypothetical protein M405DRAFT_834005 [Rhizopogon salebrosus TDB-379]